MGKGSNQPEFQILCILQNFLVCVIHTRRIHALQATLKRIKKATSKICNFSFS